MPHAFGRVWELYRPWENAAFTQFEGRPLWGARTGLVSYWVLGALAIPGFWFVNRRGLSLIPLLAQLILVTGISAFAYGSVRFRLPAEVVIVSLAALTIDTGIRWLQHRRAIRTGSRRSARVTASVFVPTSRHVVALQGPW